MGHVTITLNTRTYRLACGDGEEQRLLQLAEFVRTKLDRLASEFGQVGDDRLLVMTSLLIADELLDARGTLATETNALPEPTGPSRLSETPPATVSAAEQAARLPPPGTSGRPSLEERLARARETPFAEPVAARDVAKR